jgi:hypothetical protein
MKTIRTYLYITCNKKILFVLKNILAYCGYSPTSPFFLLLSEHKNCDKAATAVIRTARTLEAEWWQVCGEAWVRGQRKMSPVLCAFGLPDFTMLRPVLAWRAFWNLRTLYFFFNFTIFFSGCGQPWIRQSTCTSEPTIHFGVKNCLIWSWLQTTLPRLDLKQRRSPRSDKPCWRVQFQGGIDVLQCHSHSRVQSLDWGHLHMSMVTRVVSVTKQHSPAIRPIAECLEIRRLLVKSGMTNLATFESSERRYFHMG